MYSQYPKEYVIKVFPLGIPVIFLIPNYIINLGFKIRCKWAWGWT